ncbi:MAG TPA: metallophosphoesterase, partial [Bacteroidales bacterium]
EALLEKIVLTREDHLFLLGDYIDRGPDSSGVVDFIIRLKTEGYKIVALRGNHEDDLLKASLSFDKDSFVFYVNRFKSGDLLTTEGQIKEEYKTFFNSLPFYFELPDFILVHAGVNFKIQNPFEDKDALIFLRNTDYNAHKAKNRRVIYGHQPTYLNDIMAAIDEQRFLIPLDNGCVYNSLHKVYDYRYLGHLLCLDLDSWELSMERNRDT